MIEPTFQDNSNHLDNSRKWESETTHSLSAPRIQSGELEMIIATTSGLPMEGKLAIITSPVLVLHGIAVLLDGTGVSQTGVAGGSTRVRVYRHVDGADAVLFRWEDYMPNAPMTSGVIGYLVTSTNTFEGAHHLLDRTAVVRADLTMEDVTVAESGEFTTTRAAAILIAGETFMTHVETLDIDDPSSPVTGLPMNLSRMIARFGGVMAYNIGRISTDLRTITMAHLMDEEDWDPQRQVFEGVSEDIVFPAWKKQGRMSIKTEDCWPFSLLAVIPNPELGFLDEE
jgi:hypothetical protein